MAGKHKLKQDQKQSLTSTDTGEKHKSESTLNMPKKKSKKRSQNNDSEKAYDEQIPVPQKKSKKRSQNSDSEKACDEQIPVEMDCDEQENARERTLSEPKAKTGDGTVVKNKKEKKLDKTMSDGQDETETVLSPEVLEMKRVKREKMRKKKELKREEKLAQNVAQVKAAEGASSGVPGTAQILSLQYLRLWATQRSAWNFQKVRQVWLLNHMYDVEKVPEKDFAILLEYLEGLKGKARETTVQQAEKLVADYEKQQGNEENDSSDSDEDETEVKNKSDEDKAAKDSKKVEVTESQYERVRQIIQLLS